MSETSRGLWAIFTTIWAFISLVALIFGGILEGEWNPLLVIGLGIPAVIAGFIGVGWVSFKLWRVKWDD